MQPPRSSSVIVLVAIMATSSPRAIRAGTQELGPSPTDTLRVEDVVARTLAGNPTLLADRLLADAAGERIRPAGALPDPMISLGLMNRPLDDFGPDQAMTMNSVQLSQRLPWPGKRRLSQAGASGDARAHRLNVEERGRELVLRATSAYYRLAYVDRAVGIMLETRDLLRDFEEVTRIQYAVGAGLQQDLLQAQVAIARLTGDITTLRQSRVAEGARLNSLMGVAIGDPIPALDLAPVGGPTPPALELLEQAEHNRPALGAARARLDAARDGVAAAAKNKMPDLTLTVGYGQRPRFDDLASLSVGFALPAWAGSRQAPQRREAEALRAAAEASVLDLRNETYASLVESRSRAEQARVLSELYRTSILPQARAAVESALAAYRVGKVDYMTLLTNQMTVNEFRIERVRLAADYHTAVAGIDALVTPGPGGAR